MNICVFGAASNDIAPIFTEAGYQLGKALAQHGHGLVFGGGDSGMMGAVARGAHDGGGHISGVAPSFFNVDGILYQHSDEIIYTETMRQRKQTMEDMSDGFVVSPGGVGTYEEFFELLTLKQLGRLDKPIAILNTDGYFDAMLTMLRHTADQDFMSHENLKLFFLSADIGEVLSFIENPVDMHIDVRKLRYLR